MHITITHASNVSQTIFQTFFEQLKYIHFKCAFGAFTPVFYGLFQIKSWYSNGSGVNRVFKQMSRQLIRELIYLIKKSYQSTCNENHVTSAPQTYLVLLPPSHKHMASSYLPWWSKGMLFWGEEREHYGTYSHWMNDLWMGVSLGKMVIEIFGNR